MKEEIINPTQSKFVLPYAKYKELGYDDSTIQEFVRPRLKNNGYTDEQINNYFYKQGVDAATVQQVSNRGKNQVDELGKYVQEFATTKTNNDTNLGFIDAMKIGFQESADGMILRGKMPDELTQQEMDSLNVFEKAVMGITSLVADSPIYLVGGLAGGAAGTSIGTAVGGPVGGGAGATIGSAVGAFSFHAMFRQMLVDMYTRGEVTSWDEFALRMENIGIEGAKGAGMGAIMSGFGFLGKALTKTTLAARAPAMVRNYTPLGMEVLGLTAGQAAIEGRVPSADDFIVNTLLVAGIKSIAASPKAAKEINAKVQKHIYKKFILEGKTPKETAEKLISDPVEYQEAIKMFRLDDSNRTKEQLLSEKKILEKRLANHNKRDIKDFASINMLEERIYSIDTILKTSQLKNNTPIKDTLMANVIRNIPRQKHKGFTALDKEGFDHTKAISEASIIKDTVKLFNETIGTMALNVSKVPSKLGVGAFVNTNTKELRIAESNDIREFSHELGHFLNKASNNKIRQEIMKNPIAMMELGEIATGHNGTRTGMAEEGLAEFITRYLLNEPMSRKDAPFTYQMFSDLLAEVPKEIKTVIDTMKSKLEAYAKQPSEYRVSSNIAFEPKEIEKHPELTKVEELFYNAQKMLDDKKPLNLLENQAKGKEPNTKERTESDSVYAQSRIFAGVGGIIEMFTKFNPIRFEDRTPLRHLTSLSEIAVEATKIGNLYEFCTYLVAKRALELNNRGLESGIPIFDAKATVQSLKGKYEITATKFYDWHKAVLMYLRDSGVLGEKAFDDISRANEYFVSFRRDKSDKIGKSMGGKSSKIHYFKGSKDPILNPFESSLYIVNTLIPLAEKNRVALVAAELALYPNSAKYIIRESINAEMFGKPSIDKDSINKKTGKRKTASEKVIEATQKELDFYENIEDFNNSLVKNLKDNQFVAYKDGKAFVYTVRDVEAAKMLKTMSSINDVPQILKPFMKVTQVFKAGATVFNATFPILNFMRDTVFAIANSEKGTAILKKYPEAIKAIMSKNKIYKEFLANGGGQASFTGLDRLSLNLQVKELLNTKYTSRVWNSVKEGHVIEAINVALNPIRVLNEYIENTPRIAEFIIQTEGKPRTAENLFKAAYKSRTLTIDFAKGGTYARYINTLYAFFNANLLGAEVTIKLLTDKNKAPKAIAALALLGTLEALNNYDFVNGKEYDSTGEQPEYSRNSFFTIKVPGQDVAIKIPKPRGIGFISTMFSQITTQTLNAMKGTDREAILVDLLKQGLSDFTGGYSPRQLISPTVMAPLVETWANKSIFFNTPLVPDYLEKTLPEYQYRNSTTELSKTITRTLGTIIGKDNVPEMLSPIKIEALITGYTGKLGLQLLSMSDFALRKTGIIKDNSSVYGDDVFNLSIIKAFVVRYPNTGSTKSVGKFYEEYGKIDKLYNSKDPVEKMKVKQLHKAMTAVRKQIAQANQTIRNINDNPEISIDEKRQNIEPLWITINALAKKGLEIKKNYSINF